MKNSKIRPLVILLAVMLFLLASSCNTQFSFNSTQNDKELDPLKENQFYALNVASNKFYIVTAEELYENDTCVIWAEEGSGITPEEAEIIANEYDTKIRPRTVDNFGKDGILEFANWLAGRNDDKLTILLLDIQDGYDPPENSSFVAGYFFANDFYPKGPHRNNVGRVTFYSNSRDMIYIDTNPGLDSDKVPREDVYATFAHELQHLINFATSVLQGRGYMDTWVDEGLSSQAEYFYLEKNPAVKCQWFSEDPIKTIEKGNNFFVWDNHKNEPMAIHDEYATVYLFFRWLYLQADEQQQKRIFYDIITSEYSDYEAVTSAAESINSDWEDWETLLRTWFAANYAPANHDYGYKGDTYLQGIVKVKPIGNISISLYPGEGVYSFNSNSFNHLPTGNIRYAGIDANSSTIDISAPPYAGTVLLTFNANSNNRENSETGYLTGVNSSPSNARSIAGETQTWQFTGPYILDARDVLGRNQETGPPFVFLRPNMIKAEN